MWPGLTKVYLFFLLIVINVYIFEIALLIDLIFALFCLGNKLSQDCNWCHLKKELHDAFGCKDANHIAVSRTHIHTHTVNVYAVRLVLKAKAGVLERYASSFTHFSRHWQGFYVQRGAEQQNSDLYTFAFCLVNKWPCDFHLLFSSCSVK